MSQQLVPAEVCPPGDILIEELEARGWTQKDLAEIMQRPVQTINEIIKGAKQITPETAIQLAEVFETSPQFWLNLENNYRLHLAHKDRFNQQIGRRSQIYQLLPIPELIKRNWMAATKSTEELEQEVCRFLGILSLDQHPKQIGINFRYTSSRQPEANAHGNYHYC
ncbi:HigA family addiction module antitoxin [Leptolyngbya sp. 7M]|uniref:HigA family addiction module antitoxin n=1 Tax=Leptolyngbya sp. 7M TaxID=2812896 RepID=UPI001B8B288E|nr:HigA family addiction module antitoxin [Leptolyngbya sp. 7M]QYO64440.1 HigA family addiction module antidote protein [Leptolyngbya sp. 7M]